MADDVLELCLYLISVNVNVRGLELHFDGEQQGAGKGWGKKGNGSRFFGLGKWVGCLDLEFSLLKNVTWHKLS